MGDGPELYQRVLPVLVRESEVQQDEVGSLFDRQPDPGFASPAVSIWTPGRAARICATSSRFDGLSSMQSSFIVCGDPALGRTGASLRAATAGRLGASAASSSTANAVPRPRSLATLM